MKRIIYLLLTFIWSILPVAANWQRPVTNYSRQDCRSGNQNWMIAQQDNGWMYFANNKGLLEFDGLEWNTYSIHNAKTRAVKIGNDGRIYIGGMSQFGYFTPNKLGGLDYTCLSDSLQNSNDVGIVWNIHIAGEKVYFITEWQVFCLEKDQLKILNTTSDIRNSALIHNKLYLALAEGLVVLNGDDLFPLAHTDAIVRSNVKSILPFEGKILIVTDNEGLYVYDGNTMYRFNSEADSFISNNMLFCGAIRNSTLALGSVQDGVLLLNLRTNQTEKISINNGLQNQTILSLAFDRDNNLWLGLDNGVDCIHMEAPLFSLHGGKPIIGSGYASCSYMDNLYLGTNQGVYKTSIPRYLNETIDIKFVPNTRGQCWALKRYDNTLFCCSDNGISVIDSATSYHIDNMKGVWNITEIANKKNILVAGTYSGLYLLRKTTNGRWEMKNKIEGFNYSCKTLVLESSNVIWVANKGKGIYRLVLSENLDRVIKQKNYNDASLKADNNFHLANFGNEIVVATPSGLFRYNQIEDKLNLYTEMETLMDGHTTYSYLHLGTSGDIWYVANGMLKLLRYDPETVHKYYKNKGEIYLRGSLIDGFEYVYICDDEQAIIGTEEGFSLLKYREEPTHPELDLQIRKVYLTGKKDSLIYGRSYAYDKLSVIIPYSHNSLRIEYSAANYDKSSPVLYACRLIGSKDDSWSEFKENNTKEYTALHEGEYIFDVKIITDKKDEPILTSFNFKILPPWHRTWWAYIAYLLMFSICSFYAYYWIMQSRKRLLRQKEHELELQKQIFEKESTLKDLKIDSLKEENLKVELRHKSEELIRSILNIVHKNETLLHIRKVVASIFQSVNDENLVNIRRKVLGLIKQIDAEVDNEDHWLNFQTSFDSVYHDFFQLLDKKFPELTSKDKMLCAYLRMNLMSKEIAPLLNISVRGVEISRYRLRKKLNLEEGDGLAEFLQNLSAL